MAVSFKKPWADEIAEVTTSPEYQNIQVKIVDNIELDSADYNVETDTWTEPPENVVYSGRARLIGVRWGTDQGAGSQNNPTTVKAIRVQLGDDGAWVRMTQNQKLFVTDSPRNPVLESYVFTVTSDLQGGMSASRTIELALAGDSAHD